MDEKKRIEKATAEGFLSLFNAYIGADFRVIKLGDAPDVQCQDSNGNRLNLEITQTEDRPGDIQAVLGRSDHKSLDALRHHNMRVAQGKEKPHFNSLSGNVLDQAVEKICAKFLKDYGPNSALVVRDSSGVDWEWELVIDELKARLPKRRNPFDMGVWILNVSKTKLYQVIERAV